MPRTVPQTLKRLISAVPLLCRYCACGVTGLLPSFPMEDKIFSRSSQGKALSVGMSSGNTARLRPRATAARRQTCLMRGPRTDASDESLSWLCVTEEIKKTRAKLDRVSTESHGYK